MSCVLVAKWVVVFIFVGYEYIDANSEGMYKVLYSEAVIHLI